MRFLIIYLILYNTKCNLGCRTGLSKGEQFVDHFWELKDWRLPPHNDDWWGFVNLLGDTDDDSTTKKVSKYDKEKNFPWPGIGTGDSVFKPPDEAKVINYVGQSSACMWAPDSGNGYRSRLRWYYDSSTDTCRSFVYSGKGGNTNRWLTQWHCNKGCRVPPKSPGCLPDKLFNYKYFIEKETPKYPTT